MSPSQNPHNAQVATLAAEYEKQGYRVQIRPDIEQIPLDLNGYYPDLLAEKASEHLLILANNIRQPISISRLQSLVENVKRAPDWRFLLVNYSPEYDAASLAQAPLP